MLLVTVDSSILNTRVSTRLTDYAERYRLYGARGTAKYSTLAQKLMAVIVWYNVKHNTAETIISQKSCQSLEISTNKLNLAEINSHIVSVDGAEYIPVKARVHASSVHSTYLNKALLESLSRSSKSSLQLQPLRANVTRTSL